MIKVLGNNIVNAFTGGKSVNAIYSYGKKVWPSKVLPPSNNVIYYTSTDGQVVTPYRNGSGGTGSDMTDGFGSKILSNTYADGLGIITFDGDVSKVYFGFTNCSTLRTIILPSSVTEIGWSSFDSCVNLVSVNIPSSVINIGDYAFYDCKSLTNIKIPGLVSYIGSDSFRRCTSLIEVLVDAVNCPSIESSSTDRGPFDQNADGRKIKVPAGSVEAYKTAPEWSRYADDIIAQ